MLNPFDDRSLHSANVLCCIGSLATDIAAAGGAATVISATLSAKEVAERLTNDQKALAKTIQTELTKAFKAARIPEDRHSIVHDMILASVPSNPVILQAKENPDAVFQAMVQHLKTNSTEVEHKLDNNLSHFRNVVGPVLEKVMSNPTLTAALQPSRNQALWEIRAGVADLQDGQTAIQAAQSAQQDQLSEMQAMLQQIAAGQDTSAIPLDYLIDIANRFGGFEGTNRAALTDFLKKKATEFHALRAEVDAIDPGLKRLANLKTAAQDAIARVALKEVEDLLEQVQTAELEEAAKTADLRAANALLRGRVDQAYRQLIHAADSFAIVDEVEVARRRVAASELLCEHARRYGGSGLAQSVDVLSHHSIEFSKNIEPQVWGSARSRLGISLRLQAARTLSPEKESLLAQSIQAYLEALTVRTRDVNLLNWAATQNNLAMALNEKGRHTAGQAGTDLLADAVAAYENAAAGYLEARHIFRWAMTQYSMGTAIQEQGVRTEGAEGDRLLLQALKTFETAQTVLTRTDHPERWADIQHNRGHVLKDQALRAAAADAARLLTQSLEEYRKALDVFTHEKYPFDWAETQENLAISELALSRNSTVQSPIDHLRKALAHVEAALRVYDRVHTSYYHAKATKGRDQIIAALAELSSE